ncbi:MAG TPA: BlaI/MecI/CopY family transcriptional regulator [Vicinamibacterales bacterium]|jgi:predicted transcriptional regulator
MKRHRSRARTRPALSELEHQAMEAVWASGPCSVETVHLAVSRQRELKEVTIRTVLRRLEQKGYVEHEVDGRAFIYRAVEAPRSVAARAVRHILDRFCHGSVEELVTGLVEADVLSEAELEALEASIKNRARERAQKSSKKGR